MSLTRRDYVALSTAIRTEAERTSNEGARLALRNVAVRIAEHCADNAAFDIHRFMQDAGFAPGQTKAPTTT